MEKIGQGLPPAAWLFPVQSWEQSCALEQHLQPRPHQALALLLLSQNGHGHCTQGTQEKQESLLLSQIKFGTLQLAKLTPVRLHTDWESPPSMKNLLFQPKCQLHKQQHSSRFCSHARSCCQDSSWAQLHLLQPWGKGLTPSQSVTQNWGQKWIPSHSWAFPRCWSSLVFLTH